VSASLIRVPEANRPSSSEDSGKLRVFISYSRDDYIIGYLSGATKQAM
jgi:hypothetical protein